MESSEPFTATLHEWMTVFMRHSMHNFMQHVREADILCHRLAPCSTSAGKAAAE